VGEKETWSMWNDTDRGKWKTVEEVVPVALCPQQIPLVLAKD
jgi:hypothetical protein